MCVALHLSPLLECCPIEPGLLTRPLRSKFHQHACFQPSAHPSINKHSMHSMTCSNSTLDVNWEQDRHSVGPTVAHGSLGREFLNISLRCNALSANEKGSPGIHRKTTHPLWTVKEASGNTPCLSETQRMSKGMAARKRKKLL